MKSLTIVIDLQELKDDGTGMGTGLKDMKMGTLGFERTKEALHDGVIIAVSGAAHANSDGVLSQQGLVIMSGILAAAIRMMKQIALRLALRQSHVQSILNEAGITVGAHRPADNPP